MKKSYLVSSILICCAINAHASGFYVGGGIGVDSTSFSQNSYAGTSGGIGETSYDLNGSGGFGTLLAGYQYDINNNVFVATELNANLASIKSEHWFSSPTGAGSYNGTFTLYQSYGLSVLPGFYVDNNVGLYARLGYSAAELKSSRSYQPGVSGTNYTEQSKWLNGAVVGLGISAPLTPALALRLEYDYVNYAHFNYITNATQSSSVKTTSNQAQLDLIYKFS